MKIKCEYCNNYIDESEEKCPSCGAPNKNFRRAAIGVPTTIEELKQWYSDHNLPPSEVTRFFIGEDYKSPKAFGIYKDSNTGKFIVYKNKDTGERAIRYEGNDEKYAVNELYMKLKTEIVNQKSINVSRMHTSGIRPRNKNSDFIGGFVLLMFIVLFFCFIYFTYTSATNRASKGYYHIDEQDYYYGGGHWFVYKDEDWVSTSKPEYSGSIKDYYNGDYYDSDSDYSDIRDSSVYDYDWDRSYSGSSSSGSSSWDSSSSSSSHDDWDWDSSWDSDDSWDSGSSDWGSDW